MTRKLKGQWVSVSKLCEAKRACLEEFRVKHSSLAEAGSISERGDEGLDHLGVGGAPRLEKL
jgi:hypothetical protein